MKRVFHLGDDLEIVLQGQKPAKTIPKNRVVIRYHDPDFGFDWHQHAPSQVGLPIKYWGRTGYGESTGGTGQIPHPPVAEARYLRQTPRRALVKCADANSFLFSAFAPSREICLLLSSELFSA